MINLLSKEIIFKILDQKKFQMIMQCKWKAYNENIICLTKKPYCVCINITLNVVHFHAIRWEAFFY